MLREPGNWQRGDLMKLIQVTLEGALELEGTIEFPQSKIVVLYGANQQGKTNIVNAIRYAFLKEIGKRKSKLRYDDWVIPSSKEIAPPNRSARIEIIFDTKNIKYKLSRSISCNGRDSSTLFRIDELNRTEEPVDLAPFLKDNLKAGLLDALFAPEIAGGFKQLYGRDIDNSIAMMFKEITAARSLSTKFTDRLGRIQKGADAEIAGISAAYTVYLSEILKTCESLQKMREYSDLTPYEAGKTISKIEALANALRMKVAVLKQNELLTAVETMLAKTKLLKSLNAKLQQCRQIETMVKSLDENRSDNEKLRGYIETLSQVACLENEVEEPPKFVSADILQKTTFAYNQFRSAKSFHEEAQREADKLGANLANITEVIEECSAIVKVLRQKQKAGEEKEASVTKIGEKAYTVIPIELLKQDPAFTLLNKQPIPKGAEEEKKEYFKLQADRLKQLKNLAEKEEKAQQLFKRFLEKNRPSLSEMKEQLQNKIQELRNYVDGWQSGIANDFSAFVGEKLETLKKIENIEEVNAFSSNAEREAHKKSKEYLSNLNERVSQIGYELKSLDEESVHKLLTELKKEQLQIPQYEKAVEFLDNTKENWRENDGAYIDYSMMPSIAEQALMVFRTILENCIDEAKLKEAIMATLGEIINEMRERKLIEAYPEIMARNLQVNVKYKDKEVTHPAGSEKAFFSLAILTALGHYFQMPILIDEVANNLDEKNLPLFFSMALEQKSRRGIQYLLSIKRTRDFDLEGWAKEIANELEIYELDSKKIQRKTLA